MDYLFYFLIISIIISLFLHLINFKKPLIPSWLLIYDSIISYLWQMSLFAVCFDFLNRGSLVYTMIQLAWTCSFISRSIIGEKINPVSNPDVENV